MERLAWLTSLLSRSPLSRSRCLRSLSRLSLSRSRSLRGERSRVLKWKPSLLTRIKIPSAYEWLISHYTFPDALGIFPDLCPAVYVNHDLFFCHHHCFHIRCRRHQDSRCPAWQSRRENLPEIQEENHDLFPHPKACREVDPSVDGTLDLDLQRTTGTITWLRFDSLEEKIVSKNSFFSRLVLRSDNLFQIGDQVYLTFFFFKTILSENSFSVKIISFT